MIELLKEIPVSYIPLASAVAAIIGAGATLAGALLVALLKNWHDRKLAKEQRDMALRKDVFLQVADELMTAQRYLNSFSDIEMPHKDRLKIIQGLGGSIGKAQIVSANDTISALTQVNRYFGEASIELTMEFYAVQKAKAEFDNEHAQNPGSEKATDLYFKYYPALYDLFDHCMEKVIGYNLLMVDVVIAARHELDITQFDEERFRNEMDATNRAALAAIKNLTAGYRKKLGII